jgi:hypothetical protein
MPKTKTPLLFELEETTSKPDKTTTSLLLIPLSKKKVSKNDTPLEKEIRRFNRLVKNIQEMETELNKEKENEEKYERLYQKKLLPKMIKLAKVKFEFVQQLHHLFEKGDFTKANQRYFVEMLSNMLADIEEFVPESKTLAAHYLNKHVQLMTKKDKQRFGKMMEEDGFFADMDNFDVEEAMKKNHERFERDFIEEHEENSRKQKEYWQNKKAESQHQDINTLYRELARLLHPDLEQDEKIRHEKEQLMKELSRARQLHDLYAMLVVKAKAQRFISQKEGGEASLFSLEQLKRFNKELKKKLDGYKSRFLFDMMNSIHIHNNGFLSRLKMGMKFVPEVQIENELEEIDEAIRSIKYNMEQVKTTYDLENIMETGKRLLG